MPHFSALATKTPVDNATQSWVEAARLAAAVVEVVRLLVEVVIAQIPPSSWEGRHLLRHYCH